MGAHLLPHKWPFFVNPALPPKGGWGRWGEYGTVRFDLPARFSNVLEFYSKGAGFAGRKVQVFARGGG